MDCGAGRYSDEGTCRPNPCTTTRCPTGDVCVPPMGCIDDPCAGVTCPTGRRCVASDRGTAACTGTGGFDAGVGWPDAGPGYVLAAGGGGLCSVQPGAGGSSGPPLAWMLMLMLGLGLAWSGRSR